MLWRSTAQKGSLEWVSIYYTLFINVSAKKPSILWLYMQWRRQEILINNNRRARHSKLCANVESMP